MKELIFHRQFIPALELNDCKISVIDGDYLASFQQHGERVMRLVDSLSCALDVGRGDRFAVMAATCHEYLELYHAAYLGGGVINPLNLRLAGKELEYIVRDSGTEVAFVDSHFAELFHAAMKGAGSACTIRKTVLIGDSDGPHDIRYEDLIAAGRPVVPSEPEETDPVVLMYTGGTTGLPKGVLIEQRAELLNSYHVQMLLTSFTDEITLVQTPIFHAASMLFVVAVPAAGGALVLMPMFEPQAAMKLIEEHRVTQTAMVPTMIGMMLNHPSFKAEYLASLRTLFYGASPMPSALLDRLLTMFPDIDILQGYGMTESSSILTLLGAQEHRLGGSRLRSVGKPVPGVRLSIQDADGNHLATGEHGEVCAQGGNYMREYWNKPEATEEVFRGGWYHTGDAGYLDDGGYLFLTDRVKDMIISGGENIYSTEVENAISDHPSVAQVAVIGVPSEEWGESVHAVVVLNSGAEASQEMIIAHSRKTIAGYKVPKSVEFRSDPLPLSGAMKVLKRELRAPYWQGKDSAIN
jgi:long-chain acyl-CoA synthetase